MKKANEQYSDYLIRLFKYTLDNTAPTITFQVTDACNLACTYCYQINKGKHFMTFEDAKLLIDCLLHNDERYSSYIDFNNAQGVILEFIGGEPFLAIDLIDQICDYFIEQVILLHHPWATKYRFSICSNGLLYFDQKVQNFLKKHLNHLSFSISIDGNKELHDSCRKTSDGKGSYDIAIAGVNHFKNILHGSMGSKMTIAPANVQYTFEGLKNLIVLGYEDIFCNCAYEEGWTLKHAAILYEELKKLGDYIINNNLDDKIFISIFNNRSFCPKEEDDIRNWCGGTGHMLAMDYKGDLYPCIRYMESSLGETIPPFIIGNVKTGISEKEKVQCLKCIDRKTQSTEDCFNCPIAEECSWCSAYNYQMCGTPDKRVTYICIMHQARALANYYFWNKLAHARKTNDRMKIFIPEDWALKIISEEEWNLLKELEK